MHPRGWAAEWEQYVPDTPDLARVMEEKDMHGGTVELFPADQRCGVSIVKSVSAWLNPNGTPRQWCEQSQYSRQAESECIGMSDIADSLMIDGCPAARVSFAYLFGLDTLIMEQYAIVPGFSNLYYANIKYPKGDIEAYDIGWRMLHSLSLKTRGQ